MRKLLLLLVAVLATFISFSQTTYTWATPGTGGAWTTTTNWSPNGTPGANDNVIINASAAIAITAVPTGITLNSLSLTPTASVAVTLTGASAATLNVNTVNITGTASIIATLTIGNGTAWILNIPTSGNFNMNNNSTVSGNTVTNLTFASGATLNYARDGGTIPTAGYNAASTVNITGIISTSPSAPASVGNFIWNCTSQTNIAVTLSSVLTTVTGNATINSTGILGGGFQFGTSPTITITGTYTINNNSIVNSAGGTMTCNGGLILNSGASLNGSGTTTYTIGTGANLVLNSGGFVTGASTQTFTMNGGTQGATFNALISGLVNLSVAATSVTTLNSSVLLNTLTVAGGGSLVTSGGQTITVNSTATLGTTTTNGTISGGGNFTVTANGSLSIAGTGAAIQSGGSALGVSGTVSILSGAITLNGTAAQTFGSSFPTPLSIGTVTITNAAGVTVDKSVSLNALTITSGVTTISSGITLTVNGAATLPSTAGILAVAGTYTQAAGTIAFLAASTATGAGTFNLNSGATLTTANTGGIAASAASGSVQTTTRNFNLAANYTFTGGATGDGMPTTITGTVTIGTATTAIGAAYTFNGLFTTSQSLVITSPNSVTIGATGTGTHSSGTTVTGTGSYITLSGATLNIATASTTKGLFPTVADAAGLFQPTTLTIDAGTNVNYTGTTAAIPMGTRCPSTLASLTISSTGSITLAAPLTVTNLSFTGAGFINTTSTNLLTVTGTAANSITRTTTSTTAGFVVGPLARVLPVSYASGNTFLFPIGKSTTYQAFELMNPVVDAGGTITIQMESFLTAPAGGAVGTGLSGSLSTRYWQATLSGAGTLTSVSNIRATDVNLLVTQKLGQSATVGGTYNSIGGTFTTGASLLSGLTVSSFTGGTFFSAATGSSSGTFTAGSYAVGPSVSYGGYVATYPSITSALAAMAENTSLGGAVVLELQSNYVSSVESYPLNVTSSVPTSSVNTVTIRPASGVSSIINFNPAGGNVNAIFDFNGGKNFIIDGRNGGSGSNLYIGINNLGNGPALRLINDAQNDIFRFVQFTAANTSTVNGVVLFANTTGSLAANGNNSNTIDNCYINANGVSPNGIYAAGSTSPADNKSNIITNNRVYDFYTSGSTCIGINLQSGNTTWTIGTAGNGNSIYQTITRIPVVASTNVTAIRINNTSGNGFSIIGNKIGGSISGIGGSVFNFGNSTQINTINTTIYTIRLDVGTTTATSVQGNTISNINLFHSNTSTNSLAFIGIFANVGLVNIGDVTANTIGSTTSTGSINFTFRGTGTGSAVVEGIRCGNATVYNGGSINNNLIGGFTTSADFALTTGVTFNGIAIQSSGLTATTTVNNNTIGSTTIANSIQHGSSAQMPSTQTGISFIASSIAAGGVTIQNNTIANITNATSLSYSNNYMVGMNISGTAVTSGTTTVSGNIIRNLTTSSTNPTLNSNISSIVGLAALSSVTGTNIFTVSNNSLYSFTNTNNTATALTVVGMFFNAANTGGNIVERNFIHSFNTGNSNTTATQSGIIVSSSAGAASTFRNNIIRLGINADGSSNTASAQLYGIIRFNTTANNFYFNTVYVGGTGVVGGTVNTYAFYKGTTSGADDIRNNIFSNVRSNTSGTAKHFAYVLNQTTSITSNNNLYYAPGTGGVAVSLNGVDQTIRGLRASISGQDLFSAIGDPVFTANATAAAATASLAVSSNTSVTGAGVTISGITIDQAGNTRATPPAVGAFESGLSAITASNDIWTPNITFIALTNRAAASTAVSAITVTDIGTGVPTSGGNVIRMWYRNQSTSSTWASVPGTLASGNANSGTYNFTLDYSLLTPSGVSIGNQIQYYFVAQDQATLPNIWYNSFNAVDPLHSNVSTQSVTPTTITQSFLIAAPLGGTKTVGAGGDYATLTGTGGAFDAINTSALTGNLTLSVISNLVEPGTVALAQFGLPNRVNIIPDGTTIRLIEGTTVTSGVAMIRLDGADSVSINGADPVSGTGRYLRFVNDNATAANTGSVFSFINDARGDSIKNCIIESNATTLANASVLIGTTTGANGNDNDVIDNCLFQASAATNAGSYFAAVTSTGTGSGVQRNSDNSIINSNFTGILASSSSVLSVASTGNGDNWVISNNKIYNSTVFTVAHTAINFGNSSSNNITINGNSIGGAAADRSGTMYRASSGVTIQAISLTCGNTLVSNIYNNTIANFGNNGNTTSAVANCIVVNGKVKIGSLGGNVLGGLANVYDTLRSDYDNGFITISSTADTVWCENNTIGNATYSKAGGDRLCGILASGTGAVYFIRNNTIRDFVGNNTGSGASSFTIKGIFISVSSASALTIEGNSIYNLQNVNPTTSSVSTSAIHFSSSAIATVARNRIYNISSAGTGTGTSAPVNLGIYSASNATLTIVNNQISLAGSTLEPILRPIFSESTGNNKIFYNSIYLGGVCANTANKSHCYLRNNTGVDSVFNNVFYNERTGGGGNYAIGTTVATGWSNYSNYNFYAVSDLTKMGEWVSGTSNNLATWATNGNGDANSSVELTTNIPGFYTNSSTGDLSVIVANRGYVRANAATPLSAGINSALTIDYTSATRNSSSPSIGSIEYTPITWTGATNNDWNTGTNWTSNPTVPGLNDNVVIPLVANQPNIPSSTYSLKGFSLANAATLSIASGAGLQANGNITNNGTITGSGVLTLNGTTSQSLGGTGLISNLTVNNAAGLTIGTGVLQSITGVLTPTAGNITTTGKLILKSTSITNTAIVGVVGAGVTIGSNVQVERFIPVSNRAFRFLAPGVTGSTIKAAWQEGTTSSTANPNPGYGTHITGNKVDQTNGFDGTSTGNPSGYTFNTGTQSWDTLVNTTGTFTDAKTGYRVLIRGDRTPTLITNATTAANLATTLRNTGSLATGAQSFTLATADAQYSLVGNPYWAPVNWTSSFNTKTNLNSNFYIWNPTLSGTGNRGAYVAASSGNIQPGQAFFVLNAGGAGALGFVEASKNIGSTLTNTFRTSSVADGRIIARLYLTNNFAAGNMADIATTEFNKDFKAAVDKDDAPKFGNPDENISFKVAGQNLSINATLLPEKSDTLLMNMGNMLSKNYVLQFEGQDFSSPNMEAWAVDSYLNTKTKIDLAGTVNLPYVIDNNAASSAANRFYVVFTVNKLNVVVADKLEIKLAPNPATEYVQVTYAAKAKGSTTIRIVGSNGQVVTSISLGEQQTGVQKIAVNKLAAGIYTVEVQIGEEKGTARLTKL